ncbi:MAG: SMP-30/gluconolactonase/LRE family protein [Myxococcota bacterium]|nr:SMP-30/gluconolactonase/LRE family protein [Myxococcota bacterium]
MARQSALSGKHILGAAGIVIVAYLCFWPVPFDPVHWTSPPHPGDAPPYAVNGALTNAVHLRVGEEAGPEAVAIDANGHIYTGVQSGRILRFNTPESNPVIFAELPPGRPLGLAFSDEGHLYVAHAPAGLIRVTPDGRHQVVLAEAGGVPIRYADDLDIAKDGTVYLSDATTKFDPTEFGGAVMTSRLDLLEHGGHGRLIEYTPKTGRARVVVEGIHFANGVAMTHDDRGVLVVETGSYRLLKWRRDRPSTKPEVVAGPFPGFPDNVTRGQAGRYWVGIVSERSRLLDALSDWPSLRKMAYRLPLFLQPQARSTGFIFALDDQYRVGHVLRGASTALGYTVSAVERGGDLIISRLHGDSLLHVKDWRTGQLDAPE